MPHPAFDLGASNRTSVSEDVDERTQFELYYPPFEAAVNAGVLSVMCSYNKVISYHQYVSIGSSHRIPPEPL